VRNVLIAIGNSGDSKLADTAERLLADASPLVRGAAVWALSRLCSGNAFAAHAATYQGREDDALVIDEWQRGRADRNAAAMP
jgi:epoxyqueuosine reductase